MNTSWSMTQYLLLLEPMCQRIGAIFQVPSSALPVSVGITFSLDAFLALIFTIPYGLMLDSFSERSLASMNIVGFLISSSCLVVDWCNRRQTHVITLALSADGPVEHTKPNANQADTGNQLPSS